MGEREILQTSKTDLEIKRKRELGEGNYLKRTP